MLFGVEKLGKDFSTPEYRLWAHGGCDRSAEDAYSSMAPDPAFAFVGGPCCPTLDFVYMFFGTMITFNTLFTSPIYIEDTAFIKESSNLSQMLPMDRVKIDFQGQRSLLTIV